MSNHIDIERFAVALRRKRDTRSQRSVARELTISKSALSRLELGEHVPSLSMYLKLCSWLEAHPMAFCSAFAEDTARLRAEVERLRSALWSLSDAARTWAEEKPDE
jgi:transcriptional regulator with XRE-family HTH domain